MKDCRNVLKKLNEGFDMNTGPDAVTLDHLKICKECSALFLAYKKYTSDLKRLIDEEAPLIKTVNPEIIIESAVPAARTIERHIYQRPYFRFAFASAVILFLGIFIFSVFQYGRSGSSNYNNDLTDNSISFFTSDNPIYTANYVSEIDNYNVDWFNYAVVNDEMSIE